MKAGKRGSEWIYGHRQYVLDKHDQDIRHADTDNTPWTGITVKFSARFHQHSQAHGPIKSAQDTQPCTYDPFIQPWFERRPMPLLLASWPQRR